MASVYIRIVTEDGTVSVKAEDHTLRPFPDTTPEIGKLLDRAVVKIRRALDLDAHTT